jgi:hypothetical protein
VLTRAAPAVSLSLRSSSARGFIHRKGEPACSCGGSERYTARLTPLRGVGLLGPNPAAATAPPSPRPRRTTLAAPGRTLVRCRRTSVQLQGGGAWPAALDGCTWVDAGSEQMHSGVRVRGGELDKTLRLRCGLREEGRTGARPHAWPTRPQGSYA